jgi:hypothetical protein
MATTHLALPLFEAPDTTIKSASSRGKIPRIAKKIQLKIAGKRRQGIASGI